MHPSVGLTLPRLMPPGGLQFNGKYVPEGYRVGINAAVIHFDRKVFGDDAHQFRPESWLDPAAAANMDRYMFQFGYGTRTCIGKNISLAEMHKLVPTVLTKLDIEWKDPGRNWSTKNHWFVKQTGINVRLKMRY
ncbi:hypothetical protein G647_02355 [Cladophialophora carrionii CBS 160.54]|uniref:Pisatin demethylase n=1 Tax=Cladophialophora carrionii CBS 160.54 TaxID=1279043 RepID=V9DFY5_9EURO|nr:uncharacterized protein G647_02355 [Cladophialophora carrionii CBS 160.54]ETI25581.1 hypothetical protein G647_02355 [Cladophialophora carrionii CBS 160.54]